MVFWTYQDYQFANWFIPTVLGTITSIILWILPKKSYLFVVNRVLGIQKCASELSKSDKGASFAITPLDDIEGYPLIEKIEVDIYDEIIDLRRSRSWRFFIWFLTSLTISLLWTISFQKLILSSSKVTDSGECPDFTADCFIFQNPKDARPQGPYTCKPGQIVNVPVQGSIWCMNWVYSNKGMSDILEILGICGGLLCIFSSIVPFLYHLLSYKKCYSYSIAYGLIAVLSCIGILVVFWLQNISISFLTWFVIYLTTGLSILASLWALVTVHRKSKLAKKHFTIKKYYPQLRLTTGSMRRANIRRRKRPTVHVISEYSRRPVYKSQVLPICYYN